MLPRILLNLTPLQAYNLFRAQKGLKSDGIEFRELKTQGASGLSLDSGAKLYRGSDGKYFVSGYDHYGNDVRVYERYGTLVKL